MTSKGDHADIKISDFGLARIILPYQQVSDPSGTLSYAAPETLLQKTYGKQVDLWSLGVISYLLLIGNLPFDNDNDFEIAR